MKLVQASLYAGNTLQRRLNRRGGAMKHVQVCLGGSADLVSCPARARLPARNGLVNEVEFLGLITQNG